MTRIFLGGYFYGDFQVCKRPTVGNTARAYDLSHIADYLSKCQTFVAHACPCFVAFPLQKFPTDADSLTGLPERRWERVRDFRMAVNRADAVMRNCQTCIQPMTKEPPCAGHNERERDFDLVRIYKRARIGGRTFSKSSVSGLWSWVGARSHSICLPHLVQNGMCHHLPWSTNVKLRLPRKTVLCM